MTDPTRIEPKIMKSLEKDLEGNSMSFIPKKGIHQLLREANETASLLNSQLELIRQLVDEYSEKAETFYNGNKP